MLSAFGGRDHVINLSRFIAAQIAFESVTTKNGPALGRRKVQPVFALFPIPVSGHVRP